MMVFHATTGVVAVVVKSYKQSIGDVVKHRYWLCSAAPFHFLQDLQRAPACTTVNRSFVRKPSIRDVRAVTAINITTSSFSKCVQRSGCRVHCDGWDPKARVAPFVEVNDAAICPRNVMRAISRCACIVCITFAGSEDGLPPWEGRAVDAWKLPGLWVVRRRAWWPWVRWMWRWRCRRCVATEFDCKEPANGTALFLSRRTMACTETF